VCVRMFVSFVCIFKVCSDSAFENRYRYESEHDSSAACWPHLDVAIFQSQVHVFLGFVMHDVLEEKSLVGFRTKSSRSGDGLSPLVGGVSLKRLSKPGPS